MMRFGVGVFFPTIVVSILAGGALAQQAPKLPPDEDARLALIDYCVIEESHKHGQYDDFTVHCKCAVSAVMKTMSTADMQAVAKWRKPTTALKGRWETAWQGCQ